MLQPEAGPQAQEELVVLVDEVRTVSARTHPTANRLHAKQDEQAPDEQ